MLEGVTISTSQGNHNCHWQVTQYMCASQVEACDVSVKDAYIDWGLVRRHPAANP